MVTTADLNRLVDSLIDTLTIDELVRLLHQHQPALGGLGRFHTGQEALHGVAWLGEATVFPQPVGLAASWDDELIARVGSAVADELRSMHHDDPERVGLNAWAPVVNPLRNPLWGRNEEGWSEDPVVTGQRAAAYASGLRGKHPVFWKSVPTLKHLLAYNNETDRCTCSAALTPRVLHEYDLPSFLIPLQAGVIGAVMPGYNLVNGRPNHVSADLYDQVRLHDPDTATVSDAYAPSNLSQSQHAYPDRATSHAAAIRAGLDSFTDLDENTEPTVSAITEALERGLISAEEVRQAARRLLLLRARSGELTPDADPFAGITGRADAPEHRVLAREAAAAQVVLLANDGALPTPPTSRLLVVGPQARVVKQDWYAGTLPYAVSIADAAAERFNSVVADDGADRVIWRSRDAASAGGTLARCPEGWLVLAPAGSEPALTRVTDWGQGTLTLADEASGLLWRGTDNGMIAIDATRPGGWETQESFRSHRHDDGSWSLFHVGTRRWLRVEQHGGLVTATGLELAQASRFGCETVESGAARVLRLADQVDQVWVCLGNDPHLLGRETADRPELALPASQAALALAAGDRLVLLLVSSYPYALGGLEHRARAVVWSSHAGQELGHGVVDVLSGDCEPRGRLAQTWWADQRAAGELFDYDVIGSELTYLYRRDQPLFAFGHGLSYGVTRVDEFSLADRSASATHHHEPGGLPDQLLTTARATLSNPSDRVVDELVQLYGSPIEHPLPMPRRVLLASARVRLAPGELTTIELPVSAARLSSWSVRTGDWRTEPARWRLWVGADAMTPLAEAEFTVDAAPAPGNPWPLLAWAADEHTGITCDSAGGLRGWSCRPSSARGRVVWQQVEPATGVVARVRRLSPGRAAVTVTSTAGSTTLALDADQADWVELAVGTIGQGRVRVELRGPVLFDRLSAPSARPDAR